MKQLYGKVAAFLILPLFFHAGNLIAQTEIPLNTIVKQDFNAIANGLTLPVNWKISAAGGGVTSTWATGLNSLTQSANNGTPTTGGAYNWGTTAGTDRAVGFLASGSYASPNAVMAYFRNTTGAPLTTLTISFIVERYRVNTSGFNLGFFSSADGAAWTARNAGDIAAGIFADGTSAYTFNTPATLTKTVIISGLNIANNEDIYFRWVFNDAVAADAQGLGLDDVTVFAGTATPLVTSTLRYTLSTDAPPTDQANSGDELTYRTTIKNTGTGDAADVILTEPAPTNTTLVGGSIKTSALARDDIFITAFNAPLSGGNVLTNDYGIPSPSVISFGPTANATATAAGSPGSSNNGGAVTLNSDGTFTYTPPAGFTGKDQFAYIAGNGNLPDNDAIVTITVGSAAIASNESYDVVGNVSIAPNNVTGVLANDTGGGLFVTAVNGLAGNVGVAVVTGGGGNLTVNGNGSFTYNPLAGFTGSDNFTYTVDNGFSSPVTATVTLNVSGMVWFVNNNAVSNGDGRLSSPFKLITDVTGTAANQTIFLYEGAAAYSGSITLLQNQKLVGQDASESLETITGITPNVTYSTTFPAMNSGNGTVASMTATNANIITLNTGNTIRGLTVGGAGTGKKITGNSFGTLTLGNTATPDVLLNGTGQALDLTTGTLAGGLTSLTTTSSASQGVLLSSVAGTYNFGNASVTGSTTQGILISGSSSIVPTFGTTTVSSGTDGVSIQNNTGNVTFSSLGVTTANGNGLLGSNNTGQIIVTNNTSGINATGGAAINLSQNSGTSTVNLNFSGLTSSGGTNGLFLNNIEGTIAGGVGSLTGSGTALSINGGSASVTYTGSITHSAATFYLTDIQNVTGGAVTLSGNLTASGSSRGIRINDTNGATITFSGGGKSISTAANNAVTLTNNGNSNLIFSGGGLTITTTSGTGLNITGGAGSIEVTGTGNTITTTSGTCMNMANADASANGITFASLTTATGRLASINGSTGAKTLGRVQQTDANGSGTTGAISIDNAATVNIGDALASTIKTTNGTGIRIANGTTLNISGAGLDVTATGTGKGVDIGGSTIAAGSSGLRVTTGGGTGIHAIESGTAVISGSANTLSTFSGIALNVSSGTANFTFSNLLASPTSSNAIAYNAAAGTTTIGGGSIIGNATVAPFYVSGGTASITYSGNMTQTNNAETVRIEGGHATGTITFTGSFAVGNGTGLQFDNADGTYTFSGTTNLGGPGDEGIDILNGSAGTFTFGANTSITSPSGVAFNVVGGTASVTYSGNITHGTNTAMVSVTGGHATGTITFDTGTLSAADGTGLQFDNADGTYNFNGTTTLNGGDAGIDILNGSNGTFSFSANTSVTNPSGIAININTSSGGNITYSGTFSKTSTGIGIQVNAKTGGTVSFNGSGTKTLSTTTSAAINLTGNTGTVINFSGNNLLLTTTSGTGLNATGGGTISVTGTGNTITAVGGIALNVSATTIGGDNLNFQNISANGGTNGIVLNSTGTAAGDGGLVVTGNSSGNCGGTVTVNTVGTAATVGAPVTSDCTGGTIQNTTGSGISLNSTKNVSLTRMYILNCGTDGISALSVNGFTLARSFITDASGVAGDRGIEMGDFSTGTPVNGSINITNSTVGPTPHDNFGVGIANGSSTWNITNSVFTGSQINSGFNFEIRNATLTSFVMDGCVLKNHFADGMQMQPASGVSATITSATIQNSSFLNNNIHIDLNHDGTSNVTYKVLTNTLLNATANSINFFTSATAGTGGTMNGRFVNNRIGDAAVFNSGGGIGIRVNVNGGAATKVLVDANVIRQIPNGRGIEIISRNGTGGTDATVTNNNVNTDFIATGSNGGFSLSNIFLQSNCVGANGCNTLRSDVRGNTVPAVAPTGELASGQIILIKTSGAPNGGLTSTNQLVDNAPASANAAAELASQNTGSTAVSGTVALIAGPIGTPPLMAGGVKRKTVKGSSSKLINSYSIQTTAEAAIARWTKAGLSPLQLIRLKNLKFEISDLPGLYIADVAGDVIRIDKDAATYQWFVDDTPMDDSEYHNSVDGSQFYAVTSGKAAGRIDLLTAIMHEIGHYLDFEDTYEKQNQKGLMYGYLPVGGRRLPTEEMIKEVRDTIGWVPRKF